MKSKPNRFVLPLCAIVAALAFLLFVPPITQSPDYHAFADERTIYGIPNFWNVVSNFPFAVVGLLGLWKLRSNTARVLFMGVLLTCFGSSYYHLAPSDARLAWDRLPMTLVFTSLLTAVIGELSGSPGTSALQIPLVIGGVASVGWWRVTGDLRLYLLVQFGSMLVVLLALRLRNLRGLWPVVGLYSLAKVAESYDRAIYSVLPLSGHTLKHLTASLAALLVLRWWRQVEIHSRASEPAPDVSPASRTRGASASPA
jgi:hypothetical protein